MVPSFLCCFFNDAGRRVRYGGEGSKWLPHIDRLTYIYKANQRFYKMLEAWEAGDIETVGAIFREDGIGLRDEYVLNRSDRIQGDRSISIANAF